MKKWLAGGIVVTILLLWLISFPVRAEEAGDPVLDTSELDFEEVDELLEETGAAQVLEDQADSRSVSDLLQAVVSGDMNVSWENWAGSTGWTGICRICWTLLPATVRSCSVPTRHIRT